LNTGGELLVVARREAVELGVLAALDVRLGLGDLVGRDPRGGEQLHQVGAGEVLHRAGVGDLVDAAADEQVAGQRAGRRVVAHLVDLELVVARAGLEEEVVHEVLDEVARRGDVVAVPRLAVRVLTQRGRAAGDDLLRVEELVGRGQRTLLAGAGEHRVDRRGDELDVAELLGGDVGDEVVERPRALAQAEVERLERVVHEGRHLAELAAHELLHDGGAGGVGIGRRRSSVWMRSMRRITAAPPERNWSDDWRPLQPGLPRKRPGAVSDLRARARARSASPGGR
jgi:hypothetical protein